MPFDDHKNFSYSTVATAPSPATSGTSLVVAAGEGTRFPAVPFNASVWPVNAQALPTNAEIVRVTAISTDTLTITRAQEASTARTIVAGDQIAATITDKVLSDIESAIPTSSGLTVLASDVSAASITSSNTETTVASLVIPGGSLGTSGFLLVKLICNVLNTSGLTAVLTVRIKYGGTLAGFLQFSTVATGGTHNISVDLILAAAGTTSAQRSSVLGVIGPIASAAAPPTASAVVNVGEIGTSGNTGLTLDSTVDQNLDVTGQFNTASAATTFTLSTIHVLKG
jgi:hypothetical protein